MTAKYYAILTNQGAARLANATALGTKLNLTQMAVGDANGKLPTPDPAQTALINQQRIAPLNMLTVDPANASQIIAEQIIPENEGGFWIREIGLYDDDGVLIAVANCPETYKPKLAEGSGRTQTIRMILIVSSTTAITLKIDPSVVLATREYVDDAIEAHAKSRNHPDATTKEKGLVQLSSATNSDSETLAATPKAVKAVKAIADAAVKSVDGIKPDSKTGDVDTKTPLLGGKNTWSAEQDFDGGFKGGQIAIPLDGQKLSLNTLLINASDPEHIRAYSCKSMAGGDNITDVPTGIHGNFLLYVESLRKAGSTDYLCMQTLVSGDKNAVYRRLAIGKVTVTFTDWQMCPMPNTANIWTEKQSFNNSSTSTTDTTIAISGQQHTPLLLSRPTTANLSIGFQLQGMNLKRLGVALDGSLHYGEGENQAANALVVTQKTDGTIAPASYTNFDNRYLLRSQDLPVGIPLPWSVATPPAGWLKCNGAAFDKAKYPGLAVAYPSGKLPDLRGEFIRGLDDGRGADAGRAVLSAQGDAVQKFTGKTAGIQHYIPGIPLEGVFARGELVASTAGLTSVDTGDGVFRVEIDASLQIRTAAETRPRNIAFNYIVRAA